MKIGIIGGGLTGLTIAHRLSKRGQEVVVFEKENALGGLAAGFKKQNWNWYLENFFHHIFTTDETAKNLVAELGLKDNLFYLRPKTSVFYKGKVCQFDSPFSIMSFPFINIFERLRTGMISFYLKTISDWKKLEKITAAEWLKKYYGKDVYRIIWEPLLKAKFRRYASEISMVWFWARIKKRSLRLGYLRGGFQILIDRLSEKIKANGGKILTGYEVNNLNDLKKKGGFDKIIITTPTSTALKILNNQSEEEIKKMKMIGAINLVLELKDKFLIDGTYWLNVNENGFPFVAVVEHTNFVDSKYYGGNNICYIGGYYPLDHRYFKMEKGEILDEYVPFLRRINPNFNQKNIISLFLRKDLYAQPIVTVNYSKYLPVIKKFFRGIYLANMQMVYPWDRGMNYAIEMGEKVSDEVLNDK